MTRSVCTRTTVSMALLVLKFVQSICETPLLCELIPVSMENKIHIFEHCSYEIYKLIQCPSI